MQNDDMTRAGSRPAMMNAGAAGDPLRKPIYDTPTSSFPIIGQAHEHTLNGAPTPAHPGWFSALKQVLPIFIATRVAFLLLTYLSTLFLLTPKNFSLYSLPLSTLLQAWNRWDTSHFTAIANNGYDQVWRTAFFPLFPLLEHILVFVTRDALTGGLLISNLAGLVMLMALYRLVWEDFDAGRAYRSVLYLSLFPTAFFFAAAYNESLFLCLTLLSFYYMRHSQWWVAGLFGFLASLTRSAGILLLLPFLYEYARQHIGNHGSAQRGWHLDILSSLAIPAGLGVYAAYCYIRFHDALAFSQAQQTGWLRDLHGPWHGPLDSALIILHRSLLTFDSIHNVIDLSAGVVMFALVALCFIGPWKFPQKYWAYGIFAAISYLFILLFPVAGGFPLAALSRYVLEIFPAFIVLAALGKNQQFNLYYLTISLSLLSFMLLQFLTGYWII